MVNGLNDDLEAYKYSRDNAPTKDIGKYYENLVNQILESNTLISYLARYGVIPRYGFPVDNADLKIIDPYNAKIIDKYNLNRDLSVAISEYAPGSEVIVGGRKYTSRYIETPINAKKELVKEFFYECTNCQGINIFPTENAAKGQKCRYCHAPLAKMETLLHPISFISDFTNKRTNRLKPARTYSGDIRYIGNAQNPLKETKISKGAITITEYRNERLLVLNESKFYYCKTCGYTVVGEKDDKGPTKTLDTHKSTKRIDCFNKNPLERIRLGHTYSTDIVKIAFNGIPTMKDYNHAISTLYAILGGFSNAFTIERDDIGGIVEFNSPTNSYSFVIFDTVSGGAGHTKKINDVDAFKNVLEKALEIVDHCDCDADTSCYNCLSNFKNQRFHSKLKRSFASETINEMLKLFGNEKVEFEESKPDIVVTSLSNFKSCISWYSGNDKQAFVDLYNKIADSGLPLWPSGYSYVFKSKTDNKKFDVDFYWANKKVLLLSADSLDSYNALKKNPDYTVFMVDKDYDANQLFDILIK